MPFGAKKQVAAVRLFNLDLHMAVIADVKDTLARLYGERVAVTDWFVGLLDVEAFGFAKPSLKLRELLPREMEVAFRLAIEGEPTTLNEFSWHHIDQELVDRFVERYRTELEKYDGFIVTHTPVFARLFETFGKPVILVNSCRYDQPFCFHGQEKERAALHTCLHNLQEKGLLIAISNNKADQEYLRLGSGIDSLHIPSLCLYTKVKVDPERANRNNARIVCKNSLNIPPMQREALQQAGMLDSPPAGTVMSWDDMFHRRALIHFPYEMSTMSLFEQYQAGAVLLFPSRRFCDELVQNFSGGKGEDAVSSTGALELRSQYWELQGYTRKMWAAPFEKLPQPFHTMLSKFPECKLGQYEDGAWCFSIGDPAREMPAELAPTRNTRWWLDRADFYDTEWMPGIRYFDSWEELMAEAQLERSEEERAEMALQRAARNEKIMQMWRGLLEAKFPQLSK
jgi:hypothetical protein